MKREKTSALRKLSIYGFEAVKGSHNFFALLEFDITGLRSFLRAERTRGEGGSLFAFVLKAIGRTLRDFPEFNAMVDLKKTTRFEEVDVNIPVEVEADGTVYPKQHTIRNVDAKSVKQISDEIEKAKAGSWDDGTPVFSPLGLKLINALPSRLVLFVFRFLLRDHKKVKELSGTLFVTSITMFSNVSGFVLPYIGGPKAVSFALGSASKKPVVKDNAIQIREILNVTAAFNHDLVDGAPAARFINRLRKYVETDYEELL